MSSFVDFEPNQLFATRTHALKSFDEEIKNRDFHFSFRDVSFYRPHVCESHHLADIGVRENVYEFIENSHHHWGRRFFSFLLMADTQMAIKRRTP